MLRLPRALRVYNQLSSSETKLLSEVYRRSRRRSASRCPAGDPRALFRRERSHGSCHGSPLSPAGGHAGRRAGGSLSRWGSVRGPLPGRPGAAEPRSARRERRQPLCPQPDGRGRRDFSGCFYGSSETEGAVSSPPRPSPPISSPGSSGGSRGAPGAAQPGYTGTARGDGAAPPKRQPQGCRAEILCSLHLRALFDPMSCLGRALTIVFP